MNKISSYKIYTLGCKVNQYDSGSLSAKLQATGLSMKMNNADFAVINTCAVTKSALRKGRQMISRVRRENPQAKIFIIGCAVKIYKAEAEQWGADKVILRKDLENFIGHALKKSEIGRATLSVPKSDYGGRSRYFLKVQDGCRQFCSYCIIPKARGELKSRSMKEILTEAKAVTAAGCKEIILCGIHLGLYGVDLKVQPAKPAKNLARLINSLLKIKALERIRLSSIEVNEVTDELIRLFIKDSRLCRHLHIPLQSGSDKILKLMNRPYTVKIYREKINKIRKALPTAAITTDVIVGFPGETEKDFRATEEFIKENNFSKLHVFPFSAHESTPAAILPDQLEGTVKKARARRLNEISAKLEKKYVKQFKGRSLAVIIDGRINGSAFRGRTEYHFNVKFRSEKKYRQGQMAEARNWQLL